MGIKNLNKLLRSKCPDVFEQIHISEYAFQKVAIDVSLFMCKFKAISGDKWIISFINLVSCLRRNEIHCVFVYDNGSPDEKRAEKEERMKNREKTEEKIYNLEYALEEYHKTGEIHQSLKELHDKIMKDNKTDNIKSLLRKDANRFDIKQVENKIEKMRNYMFTITPSDFELTRELFRILKIPYYIAPLEAETMCADLCKRGLVDAVLTEDTDVLAYGCPVFLTKIDTTNDNCVRIRYDRLLEQLELDENQFLDLCIMCGCDYNTNIPKVGCETSYKYIKEYKTIEGIETNKKIDVSVLNHVRTRELFKDYTRAVLDDIPYTGRPDNFDIVRKFMVDNDISINFDKLKRSLIHNIVVMTDNVFEDENVEVVIEDDE